MSVLEAEGKQLVSMVVLWLAAGSLAMGLGFRRAAIYLLLAPLASLLAGGIFFLTAAALFGRFAITSGSLARTGGAWRRTGPGGGGLDFWGNVSSTTSSEPDNLVNRQ